MPGKKRLPGVGTNEQRQYEHIKESAGGSGRYGKRASEVAVRTVLKQHKEKWHSKGHCSGKLTTRDLLDWNRFDPRVPRLRVICCGKPLLSLICESLFG